MTDGKQPTCRPHPARGAAGRARPIAGIRGARRPPCATDPHSSRSSPAGSAVRPNQVPVRSAATRLSLGVRWLVQAARKRSGKSMGEKLRPSSLTRMNGLGAAVKAGARTRTRWRRPTRPSAISSGSSGAGSSQRGKDGSALADAEHRKSSPISTRVRHGHRAILFYTQEDLQAREVHEGAATWTGCPGAGARLTDHCAATTCFLNDHRINIIDTPGT